MTRVCRVCRKKIADVNLWTENVCKWCWQKHGGKTIHAYDLRDTTQYRRSKG